MLSIPHLLIGQGPDSRTNYVDTLTTAHHSIITRYIQSTSMDCDGTWGSAIEIACLSHLVQAPIYMYDVSHEIARYTTYFPSTIDKSLTNNVNCMSLYTLLVIILM